MSGYILRRFAAGLLTLVLLSAVVFGLAQLLPGNVGRSVLGQYASPTAVAAYNHEHGTDRPVVTQYLDWLNGLAHGDLGTSLVDDRPIWSIFKPALINSLKLATFAFLIVVPFGVFGGVIAGLAVGRPADRGITVVGLSLATVPEFVTGLVLILVFAIWLGWLPATATATPGAGALTQMRYLILPAGALALVYFGYIARMTRAGVVEALEADYTRTAYLKGLPQTRVICRHVLRNALMPTIAVIATQIGYLVGGLVAIEFLFNYHGLGYMMVQAGQLKDYTVLTAGAIVMGVVYVLASLAADVVFAFLNPRIRYGTVQE